MEAEDEAGIGRTVARPGAVWDPRRVHRGPLLALLDRYAGAFPAEAARTTAFRDFVRARPDCFLRSCPPGHVTGSAWIVSPSGDAVLLTHHRKLGRWLQLGGHADGEPDVLLAALREAREESGLRRFELLAPGLAGALPPLPLDLDVHAIPARGAEPAHLHYDVRFLLLADPREALVVSDESHALRWLPRAALGDTTDEESQLRMARKADAWLAARR